jgi:type IV secretion system protein VirD4
MRDIKARAIGTGCFLLLVVAINSFCTQFVAYRMAYHPALGDPLFAQIYNPFSWWQWFQGFYSYAPETYGYALLIFGGGLLLSVIAFRLYIGITTRSSRKHEGTHGTAHFATPEEVWETGLLHDTAKSSSGVYCGGYFNEKTGRTLYLRHNGPEHICVIAPTRSGKGVGLVVPTLLSWPESVFVLDRKGENYAMTAGWRQKYAHNTILRFDPAEPGISCRWNPLGEIRFGTRYQVSDAQNIALMVIDDDGKGIQGNHFRSAAFELLVGLILHALYKSETVGREPSLQDCAHMLTGVGSFAAPDNRNKPVDEGDPRALAALFLEMKDVTLDETDPAAREAQLAIRGAGQRFADTPSRELGSIISTANNALSLYRDPIVGENTSRSDFKIADLMNCEDPVSLYFITTPRNADRMKPLARLLLTQIVLGLADRMEFDRGRSKTAHRHRLLLMLDEFPTLGKLDVFESALAYIAGYGMKAYIITQDVQQLYKAYSSYESIVSNCHIRIAYAPNKLETAEWLSKMTGQTTVINDQVSVSGKRFGLFPGQFSSHFSSTQRPLMTSDEIMRLPGPKKDANGDILEPGEMLVFVAGQPVIRGKQILYFLDPIFANRSKIAPPKVSDVVREDPHGFMII